MLDIYSKSAGKSASAAMRTDVPEGVPNTNNKEALIADDHEPVSGVATSNERYLMAWRQVISDDANTEGLYETILESCSRESWTALGYATFEGFCCERLGVDKDSVTEILIRRFDKNLVRLLTVAMPRQGVRSDLDRTSRSDGGKFGLRTDSTTRAALVAIKRAPAIERLIGDGLLSFELAAKLGHGKLSEAQIEKVKHLGTRVDELMQFTLEAAKKEIRHEVEAVVGKPKSSAAQLAERLRKVSKADLREALTLVPGELLREVMPPELLAARRQEFSQDLAEPLPSEGEANARTFGRDIQSDVGSGTIVPSSDKTSAPGQDCGGVLGGPNRDDAGDGAVPNEVSVRGAQDPGATASMGSDPVSAGVDNNEPQQGAPADRARQLRRVPDWDLLNNALARPLDVQIGDFDAHTSDVTRLSLPLHLQLKDLLGEDITLFRSRTINHRRGHIASAAASSHMHCLVDGRSAPSNATIAVVYLGNSGRICFEGFGRVSDDGRLPDDLVFVAENTSHALVLVRGPRTAPRFGTEMVVMVHQPEAVTTDKAAE